MQPIDGVFNHKEVQKTFMAEAGQSTLVSWEIDVPENIHAVVCRVVAQAGNFSQQKHKVTVSLNSLGDANIQR